MTWFLDMDHFSISKSVVVADIDNLIAAILGIQGPATAEALAQITSGLHHQMEDFEEQQMNPYEADAIEMAIRTGHLAEHYAKIIHGGPDTPGYEQAVQEALMIGRPMVNHAAQVQNQMNTRFEDAPVPFKPDGSLDPAYLTETRSTLARQTGIKARGRDDTSFNPFDPETGQLVTHITSGYSKGNVEGYARWYEPAAKQLRYIEKRWSGKSGNEENKRQWLIPAHYIHRNVINVNDTNHLHQIGEKVKELQSQGLNHAQIKEGLMAEPMVYHATHQSHHDPASTHGRIGRKADEAQVIRETPVDGGAEEPAIGVDGSIIHPELRNLNWFKWANAPPGINPETGRYTGGQREYEAGRAGIGRGLIEHHGWTPADVKMAFDPTRVKSMPGRNRREQILNSIYQHEMRDGVAPQWYTGGHTAQIQPEAQPVVSAPPAAPAATPDPRPVAAPPAPVAAPPAPRPVVAPVAAPVAAPPAPRPVVSRPVAPSAPRPVAAGPPPPTQRMPSTPLTDQLFGITSNKHPTSARPVIPRGEGKPTRMSQLATVLGRLSATDIFRRSEEYRPMFEDYIEEVQMELAKAVIEDKLPIKKMEVESPYDIAMLSSQIQKPTSEVIAIYHTRGDWRNIAESFGISHDSVQLVKVSLHG